MPDWKKEIKLSDLFGSGKKPKEPSARGADGEAVAAPTSSPEAELAAPKAEGVAAPEPRREASLLKKEIKLSLRRKERLPRPRRSPRRGSEGARARRSCRGGASRGQAGGPSSREGREEARRKDPKQPRRERRKAPAAPPCRSCGRSTCFPTTTCGRLAAAAQPAQLVLAVVALVVLAASARLPDPERARRRQASRGRQPPRGGAARPNRRPAPLRREEAMPRSTGAAGPHGRSRRALGRGSRGIASCVSSRSSCRTTSRSTKLTAAGAGGGRPTAAAPARPRS